MNIIDLILPSQRKSDDQLYIQMLAMEPMVWAFYFICNSYANYKNRFQSCNHTNHFLR